MAAFIHVEVSWAERPQVVGANVRRMLGAVAHYPWAAASVKEVSADSNCCVMGVQRQIGAAHSDVRRNGATAHIVADIQLHARDELAARLGLSPTQAVDLSDEALVLRAYQRWGVECANLLVGDGVFALWDASSQRLVCWRDAAGVRPLYYHHVPGRRLVVSSDLQSIAEHPSTPPVLDLPYTKAFLRSEPFVHPTRTLIEGVRKVPSAHILTFDRGGLRLQRYWDPESITERADVGDGECAEELRELLRESIRGRLASTRTGIGAHLSGGLDSSSIATVAASLLREQGEKLSAFSWSPPWKLVPKLERDERDLVEVACQAAGLQPRYTALQPIDVVDFSYRDVALCPRSSLNFEVATSRLAVERGVRTILSGWGGDEAVAFNGRGYFADLARRGRIGAVHRELTLRSRIHGGTLRGAWKSRVVTPLLPDAAYRRRPVETLLPAELRPDFAHLLDEVEPLEHIYPRERPGVHRMQAALLQFGHLQYRMEAWAAHGAALGLTYTFPLLDRRIMEFALSLPGRMFFREGWKRWIYRKATEGIVPDRVRWNPDKYDTAATHQLRKVLLEPADVYREPLLGRRDNPLVDVSVLLDMHDRSKQLESSPNESPPPPAARPVGSGVWLAFTRLRPA